MINQIKAEILSYRIVSMVWYSMKEWVKNLHDNKTIFLQLFFEFEYLNNHGKYSLQILFPYSPYPFRGNHVSDFSFRS